MFPAPTPAPLAKRGALAVALFAAALGAAACLLPLRAAAAELTGEVVAVADGDTLTVLDAAEVQHKIRLAAVDAPERRQAYGQRARQHLAGLTFRQPVTVTWHKADRYGRKVALVSTATTPDVGLAMLIAGLGWHYVEYAREQRPADRIAYEAAQRDAQTSKRGLWADTAPQPPWLFRRAAPGTMEVSAFHVPPGDEQLRLFLAAQPLSSRSPRMLFVRPRL